MIAMKPIIPERPEMPPFTGPKRIPSQAPIELAVRANLSNEQFQELANQPPSQLQSREFQAKLKSYNIPFNQGEIFIKVDGIIKKMNTDENDFGTTSRNLLPSKPKNIL
ncbi:MAG TPA: hypothetical protein PL066_01805 [bacterium]|nr:hypothetical protein [bacterium]